MRLGGVIYIAPFLFVLNPALVGQAPAGEIIVWFTLTVAAVWLMSSALQGYIIFAGDLGSDALGMLCRFALIVAAVLMAAPIGAYTGLPSPVLPRYRCHIGGCLHCFWQGAGIRN